MAEVVGGEVAVTHGDGDVLVAEEGLDRGDIRAAHDEAGGKGMAQVVEAEIADSGAAEGQFPRRRSGYLFTVDGEYIL